MNIKTYLAFFILLIPSVTSGQNFNDLFELFIQKENYKNATVGAVVIDLDNQKEVFSYQPSTSMVPGSLLKLVTSSTAIEILKPGYRFKTEVLYTGTLSKQGELTGNLIIRGSGDPTLGSSYFEPSFMSKWAFAISKKGIKKIKGDIILDISAYEEQSITDSWIWEDIGNYYGAGAKALSVFDNTLKITLQSYATGSPTKIIGIKPEIKGISFINHVLASDKNSDQAYVYGSPWGDERVIRGTIPKHRDRFTIKAALPNPELVLGSMLKDSLAYSGIPVTGNVKAGKINTETNIAFTGKSVELSQIIRILNHESVNLIAEHLVKQLALESEGLGSTEKGLEIIHSHWQHKRMDTHGLFLEDGSGLSHFNLITPGQMGYVLKEMYQNSSFTSSLPEAGKGTLYVFSKKDFPGKTLICKSGSMTRVRNYAGYLKTDSGKNLAFVFMVNNFGGKHIEAIREIKSLLISMKQTM